MKDKREPGHTGQESKYAKKRNSGKMMYGPGCCAHTIGEKQIRDARARARGYAEYTPLTPYDGEPR